MNAADSSVDHIHYTCTRNLLFDVNHVHFHDFQKLQKNHEFVTLSNTSTVFKTGILTACVWKCWQLIDERASRFVSLFQWQTKSVFWFQQFQQKQTHRST